MPVRPNRRSFLKLSTAAASLTTAKLAHAGSGVSGVGLSVDPLSPIASAEPVLWAAGKLRDALISRNIFAGDPDAGTQSSESPCSKTPYFNSAGSEAAFFILAAAQGSQMAEEFHFHTPITRAETVALVPGGFDFAPAILVTGVDARGIAYGLLELAERVRLSDDPMSGLRLPAAIVESSPNKVRSVARAFLSEIEDKSWFYDRAFWAGYLDTLAAARFNRFNFALGFGWDFPRGVTGDYLHFPYPYLVELPAYPGVHVEPALEAGERQRNLETLQLIAAETARRGMEFQLGIWTHAYQWTDSPHSDHHIVGLTPETHAPYCRDALAALLKACPQITGLTLRIHGESGIPEGSYPFWQTLFEAITGAGRKIEIDMHAKGLNQIMIDMARKTGMPVKAGAKYWAEHLGLGYQQSDIRAAEYPKKGVTGTFAVSSGERNFTRYGYGDFYQEGSGIDLLYRVWPGTQKHLLWGDAALAAGYGRAANFCGAAGMELCEPLTFKGREGSGHPGGRDAYSDSSLGAAGLDTAKFAATYMLWGRYLYNPDTDPEFYHRYLREGFGPAGPALETALAAASRILPLVTTAWCPSASNHEFWPEMLTPVSILPIMGKPLYTDSPAPHNVSAISPLDPQLFTTIDQHAKDLVSGAKNARYSTSEVIAWLETLVATSSKGLEVARTAAGAKVRTPEFRRAEEDILILIGLGTYYANTFHAALFYSIHEQTRDATAATESLSAYRRARDAWSAMAARAKTIYESDISYGSTPFRRGHWADRLPMIEEDVAALEKHFGEASASGKTAAGKPVAKPAPRPAIAAQHMAPKTFHAGSELALTVTAPASVTEAVLWYRHVNQGERWNSTPMQAAGGKHTAAIPAAYTLSPFPLQYYFELRTATAATLHPALNTTFSNQPYFAVHTRA